MGLISDYDYRLTLWQDGAKVTVLMGNFFASDPLNKIYYCLTQSIFDRADVEWADKSFTYYKDDSVNADFPIRLEVNVSSQ